MTNTNSERLVYHATDIIRFGFISLEGTLRGTRNSQFRPSGAVDPVWYNAKDLIDPTSSCAGSFRQGIPAIIIGVPTSLTMPYSPENLKTYFGWTDEDVDVLLNNSLTKVADTTHWRISPDIAMDTPGVDSAIIDPRTKKMFSEPIKIMGLDDDTIIVEVANFAFEGRRFRHDGRVAYGIKDLRKALKSHQGGMQPHLSRQERRALERRQAKGR